MKKIIIADDSSTARMFIRRCLQIIGLGDSDFTEAEDGKIALDAAKADPPDLLITDLNMPNMDGEELLKRVKSSPKLNILPVLVITSAGNPAREKVLLEMGAIGVLHKPVSPAVMVEALSDFMD